MLIPAPCFSHMTFSFFTSNCHIKTTNTELWRCHFQIYPPCGARTTLAMKLCAFPPTFFLPYAFPRAIISQNLLAPPEMFGGFRSGLVSLKEFSTSQSSSPASSPTLSVFINPNMLKSQTSLWFNQTLLCRNEAKSLFFPTAQHFLEHEDRSRSRQSLVGMIASWMHWDPSSLLQIPLCVPLVLMV